MERFLFAKLELWIVLLLGTVGVVVLVAFGAILKSAIEQPGPRTGMSQFVVDIASVPENFEMIVSSGLDFSLSDGVVQRNPQILPGVFDSNFIPHDDDFSDDGILLVSAYSEADDMNVVYLYDLSLGEVTWQWRPDPDAVVASSPRLTADREAGRLDPIESRQLFRAQSPLVLDDGSLVVTSGEGSLSQWSACSALEWANDRHFHHSIEPSEGGVVVPNIVEGGGVYPQLKSGFRDDGYAIVDENGLVVREESILDILYDNNLFHKVLGRNVGWDPVHLNDAELIAASDAYVEAGDIMFSSRHLSAVFLYRPRTGEVVWYEEGPWLAQHDIDYLGDGRFSLYGNDNTLSVQTVEFPYEHSTIYHLDLADGAVTKPFDAVFEALQIRDASSSTHRMLRNGDAFIERSTTGHMWRISTTGPRWQYVHRTADGIGAMQWSRYYYRDELDLSWMEGTECSS
jgi:hypothetical protein